MGHATMDIKSAAVYLGVSPRTIACMIKRGDLPIIEVGRRILLHRNALDEFLKAHEHRRGMRDEQG